MAILICRFPSESSKPSSATTIPGFSHRPLPTRNPPKGFHCCSPVPRNDLDFDWDKKVPPAPLAPGRVRDHQAVSMVDRCWPQKRAAARSPCHIRAPCKLQSAVPAWPFTRPSPGERGSMSFLLFVQCHGFPHHISIHSLSRRHRAKTRCGTDNLSINPRRVGK